MNENVTNKIPKGKRWLSRLLVSALCILLASSLLFVGVVADVGVLSLVGTSSFSFPSGGSGYTVSILDLDFFVTVQNEYIYLYRDDVLLHEYYIPTFVTGYLPPPDVDYHLYSCAFDRDRSLLYLLSQYGSVIRIITLVVSDYSIISSSFASYTARSSADWHYPPAAAYSGHVYFLGADNSFYDFFNGDLTFVKVVTEIVNNYDDTLVRSGSCYCDGLLFFPGYRGVLDSSGNYITSCPAFPIFVVDGLASYSSNNFIYSFDPLASSFSAAYQFFDFSYSGYFFGFDSGSNLTLLVRGSSSPYHVGLFSFPSSSPESSDETTESPPPESSDDSSEDPSGGTKIWGSVLNADGSYTSSLLGTLDLSQATEVRAYIGSWTSQGSPFQSETPVPLTFYVYNGEEGPPDIYTFDYHAAGYSLSGDSASDFTFPDLIGQFFTLPFNGETDLYFANVAPYGTVLVSTPFGDSFGGRVMLNLVSADSYFRLDFVDEDTFTAVVYNEDPVGSRVSFEIDIRAYREGYRLEDGETSSSRWFYPSFGSSASYTAEYVIENGLYLVFVDSVSDTVYPWEDGTWSDIIGDANSRLEDISVDHALLESMANDAYGQYSFDPMTNQNFVGAVSQFNDIRDSSGGEYILRYMWGMWNVHPFASSMIAIVGTLAIVGFIIRKM